MTTPPPRAVPPENLTGLELQVPWDAAFQKIAHQLNALASPDEAVSYTSGRQQ